jgi:hypothetical protein
MANNVKITDELIPLMEQSLFENPKPSLVFSQFSNEYFNMGQRKGDTVRIMAPDYLAATVNPRTARTLSSLGTLVSSKAVQSFTEQKQEITLNEWIGPGTTTDVSPLQLQEYDWMHSIHDLAGVNGAILAEDYHKWRDDMYVQALANNTFRIFVNNKASVSSLASTDLFTADTFADAAAQLATANVPAFPDGNYIAVITPKVRAELYKNQKFLDATAVALRENAPVFRGDIGSYVGARFVVSTNIPTVSAGSSGTPFTAQQVFLFGQNGFGLFPVGSAEGNLPQIQRDFFNGTGAGPLVQVNGMPVEARFWEVNDYGRFSTVIWLEHSEYVLLDPNPGSGKTKGVDSRYSRTLYGATSSTI